MSNVACAVAGLATGLYAGRVMRLGTEQVAYVIHGDQEDQVSLKIREEHTSEYKSERFVAKGNDIEDTLSSLLLAVGDTGENMKTKVNVYLKPPGDSPSAKDMTRAFLEYYAKENACGTCLFTKKDEQGPYILTHGNIFGDHITKLLVLGANTGYKAFCTLQPNLSLDVMVELIRLECESRVAEKNPEAATT